MKLTRAQFETAHSKGALKISIIGMSNIGKSYWSSRLALASDMEHVEIDEHIQKRLALTSIENAAQWMGQPYEDGYSQRANEYLALENDCLMNALTAPGNAILDTTGSVVHLPPQTLSYIKERSMIVYLQANEAAIQTLIKRFSLFPKPLIWGEHYNVENPSDLADVLMECYANLLSARAKMYSGLADVVIPVTNLAADEEPGELLNAMIFPS